MRPVPSSSKFSQSSVVVLRQFTPAPAKARQNPLWAGKKVMVFTSVFAERDLAPDLPASFEMT